MKLKQRTGFFYGVIVMSFILIIASCNKMNSTYYDFIKNGERTYAGKADSLKAFAGKNRLQLTWLLIADPSIKKCKIFWQEGGVPDSMEIVVNRTSGIDTINAIVNNLDEGTYTFSVYTYDKNGNRSVESNTIGTVFGPVYQSSLFNRLVKNISLSSNPVINWSGPGKNAVGTDLDFTKNDGELVHTYTASNNDHTTLPDYKSSSPIIFRTKFLPTPNAIDTFYSDWDTLSLDVAVINEQELDKSKFVEHYLPGDANVYGGNCCGYDVTGAFDYDNTSYFHTIQDGDRGHTVMPGMTFTFDMKESAKLSRFKLWQRSDNNLVYRNGNVKKFEVYGSNEMPNASGSMAGWTKLNSFELIKPSGLGYGQTNAEDIQNAKDGHEFIFDLQKGTIPVRYIRFKILTTWNPDFEFFYMNEMSFWGEVQ
ncbi:MAG: DUF4998 domain-containing protein [Ginsengibacter sp.]